MATSASSAGSCPHCGEPLRAWTVGDVTVDGCDACGGCWFDGGELPALASLEGEALAAAEAAFAPGLSGLSGGGSGRCPRCAVKLAEQTMARTGLQVQACPSCEGIWFDEGRLQVLQQTLPEERRRRPAEVAAGPVHAPPPPVRCPHCGEPNAASQAACASCGGSLTDVAAGQPGDVLGAHGIDWAVIKSELQYALLAVIAAWVMWDPPRHGHYYRRTHLGVTPDLGLLMTIAGIALLLWYSRWLLKTWRMDVAAGGLWVTRLTGRRFIAWADMHQLITLDLPGRVRPSFFAPRSRPIARPGAYGRAMSRLFDGAPRQARTQTPGPGDRIVAEELRGAVLLFTKYGLVTIGPHLLDSGGLYQTVRDHWDD